MPTYSLEWSSTVAARYDTDMNERARKVVGVDVIDQYGGSDGHSADNGITIEVADVESATQAGQRVADEVGLFVNLLTHDSEQRIAVLRPTDKDS